MYRLKNQLFLFLSILCFTGCTPQYAKFTSSNIKPAPAIPPPITATCFTGRPIPGKRIRQTVCRNLCGMDMLLTPAPMFFFLYPTTLTDPGDPRWNADINDAAINAKTDYSPILYQASAFNGYRVFSPRYRQAHVRSYFSADTTHAQAAFDTAYEDIRTAFQYYLAHFNNGRPIVIASHSQGSTHAQRLLKEFFENSRLQKQLVVAYVLGMYIPPNQFTSLKMCNDSLQTGCICAWRTLKKNYEPDFVVKEKGSCLINNPLTWSTPDLPMR